MKALALVCLAALQAGAMDIGNANPRQELRGILESGSVAAKVREFYEGSGYELAWVRQGAPTPRARQMIGVLRDAKAKGLEPEDYRVPDLGADAAPFDVALTGAAMRYLSDVSSGRANPGLYAQAQVDCVAMLRRVIDAPDVAAAIAEIEPPFEAYRWTLKALESYRKIAGRDDGELLPDLPKVKLKVQAGDSYAGVPRLAQLLRAVGDLPDGAAVPDKYSGPLVEAVKRFQNRHGLEADGVIGKATLAALNVPLNQRVRQLELALERWRWLPHTFSRPPIVVNLPEFDVRALDGDLRTSLEMKVVVGKALRWQTPPFSAQLEQVIFRPYWNVPRSILKNELLGEIARDRSYLIEHEYEVVTARGEVVTNGVVSDEILAKLRSGALMLRQVPGPNNALGLVKFVFPNPNDVYMHDTPSRALFARARRDFSHGCIRLEHAAEMADWVLRDEGWSSERIRAAMHGSVTLPVNLKQPIPVLILYRTAVVAESGEVHFFEDVYGQDAALDMQIRSARLTSGALGLHLHE